MDKYPIAMWVRWSDGSMTHDKYAIPKPKKTWGEITYKGVKYTMEIINSLIKELVKLWNKLWSKINAG